MRETIIELRINREKSVGLQLSSGKHFPLEDPLVGRTGALQDTQSLVRFWKSP